MGRSGRFTATLTLCAVGLAACGENPTQPDTTADLAAAASAVTYPPNSWTARAPNPNMGALYEMAAGTALNPAGQRIAYVFGGHFMDFQSHTIMAYNHASNSWTEKNARFSGWGTNGVGNIGGKLYISGGNLYSGDPGGSMFRSLYVYNPATDVIVQKADMPRATAYGVTGVLNGKLYVLSGDCRDDEPPIFDCDVEINRRLLYRYDPATNSWATLPAAPHSHRGGGGGVINGKFYVAGGASRTLDVYDPWSNRWTTLAPPPAPRSVGAIMNNKLWMIGGSGSNRTTYVYDPVTNRWFAKAPYPAPAAGSIPQSTPATAVTYPFGGQSHLLALGGSQGEDERPAPSQLYTP
jgi:N-acetylneuraminic acid mutarotase